MRLPRRTASFCFLAAGVAIAAGVSGSACFPGAGNGVDPPAFNFYFPVGLAVSRGGNVLYAINSDFDLQWNGGTIQSLDLHAMRRDAVAAIADPQDPNLPFAQPPDPNASCPNGPPAHRGTTMLPGTGSGPP